METKVAREDTTQKLHEHFCLNGTSMDFTLVGGVFIPWLCWRVGGWVCNLSQVMIHFGQKWHPHFFLSQNQGGWPLCKAPPLHIWAGLQDPRGQFYLINHIKHSKFPWERWNLFLKSWGVWIPSAMKLASVHAKLFENSSTKLMTPLEQRSC